MILLRTSTQGILLIEHFESCRLAAYPDPATGGKPWTIGWGHCGLDVRPGLEISQACADDILREEDLPGFELAVNELVSVPMRQCEFNALVSFAFNVGADIDGDDIVVLIALLVLLGVLFGGLPLPRLRL